MKLDLLPLLACPNCHAPLETTEAPPDPLVTGELRCKSGCGSYPVERGVPRLLPELARQDHAAPDYQHDARHSFGAQWEMHEYGDTTWGITVEERIEVVLHEFGWTAADLKGKCILDAGCGNGSLSLALAKRGATVVAADLSGSVFRAAEHCPHPRLHFVQANLFFPPLARDSFDAIYSCGVFHHTPDTRRAFDAVAPLLRPDEDARYFVWLYAPRSKLFNATVEKCMKATRRMSSRTLVPLCRTLSPLVEVSSRLLTRAGAHQQTRRNLRDRAVQLHDLLSPSYVWYHTFDEAREWAKDHGFRAVERIEYQPPTEAPQRVRSVLAKYRGVCRPGFGMLCHGPRAETSARS